ncbi:potassium voltage-gated channel subfamily A member 10-like [Bolinopsis microptera]|uniref:potassium voltage-gated channel subfamily A member 10-like n=1 Tax=Bolinopsis microptera TaxID=2820187 RepID=UPI0030792E6F
MEVNTDDSGFAAGSTLYHRGSRDGEYLLMNNLPTNHDEINGDNNNHVDDSCTIALREAEPKDTTASPKKIRRKDKLLHINVCGSVYITRESTLAYFPETLLGSSEREDFFHPEIGMYYFNRNRSMFDAILYFYQSKGVFKPPTNIDEDIVNTELEFYKISLDDIFGAVEEAIKKKYVPTTLKQKIREFMNNPHYSKGACVWAVVDIIFICISLTLLVMETIPEIVIYFTDNKEPLYMFFLVLDTLVIAFFSVDLFIRLITWKNMIKFLTVPMHIMDILSILPFYIGLIADMMSQTTDSTKQHGYVALRVCRTFRIVRIFKFVRHSKELIVVMKVISGAAKEFLVLLLLILIFVLTCGTIMYYIECTDGDSDNHDFKSILEGCWWAVVTITTVGYGDVAPRTHLGRIFGSLVVVMGIVILALPMTIIVSKFSSSYDEEKRFMEQKMIARLRQDRETQNMFIWEDESLKTVSA